MIVRVAFKDLLKAWGKQHNLVFLAEYRLKIATKSNIMMDGALLHELRMPLGYWEAKDESDDLYCSEQFLVSCPTVGCTSRQITTLWRNIWHIRLLFLRHRKSSF